MANKKESSIRKELDKLLKKVVNQFLSQLDESVEKDNRIKSILEKLLLEI